MYTNLSIIIGHITFYTSSMTTMPRKAVKNAVSRLLYVAFKHKTCVLVLEQNFQESVSFIVR